jgi:hypothetical protein
VETALIDEAAGKDVKRPLRVLTSLMTGQYRIGIEPVDASGTFTKNIDAYSWAIPRTVALIRKSSLSTEIYVVS